MRRPWEECWATGERWGNDTLAVSVVVLGGGACELLALNRQDLRKACGPSWGGSTERWAAKGQLSKRRTAEEMTEG